MSNQLVIRIFLFILFVIPGFSGITIFASHPSTVDSIHVLVRQPNSKFVDTYKSQKEFCYTQPPIEHNFLKQIWNYLQKRFGSLSKIASALPLIFKVLLWGIVLFFLFIIITQTRLYKIFYSDREIKTPDFNLSTSDHQIIDYDGAIRLQVEQKHYRMAVRLLFHKGISMLRNKELIHYSKDKTNFDYLRDLTNDDLKSSFFTLTSIFNHVWYGDIEIAEDQYLRFEKSFQSFYTAIDVQE